MKRNPTREGTIAHLAGTKAKAPVVVVQAQETEKGKVRAKAGEELASTADNQVTLPGNALRATQWAAKVTDLCGSRKREGRSAPRRVADTRPSVGT